MGYYNNYYCNKKKRKDKVIVLKIKYYSSK